MCEKVLIIRKFAEGINHRSNKANHYIVFNSIQTIDSMTRVPFFVVPSVVNHPNRRNCLLS